LAKASELFAKCEKEVRTKGEQFLKELEKERDGQWYLTALKQGTLSDKISALSMLIQRDPISGLSHLMQLLALAKKPNHKMAE
jgi:hypothetical protein